MRETKVFKDIVERNPHLSKQQMVRLERELVKVQEAKIGFVADTSLIGSFGWQDAPQGWEYWVRLHEGRGKL